MPFLPLQADCLTNDPPTVDPLLESVPHDAADPALATIANQSAYREAVLYNWVSFAEAHGDQLTGGIKQRMRRTHPMHWPHNADVRLRVKQNRILSNTMGFAEPVRLSPLAARPELCIRRNAGILSSVPASPQPSDRPVAGVPPP